MNTDSDTDELLKFFQWWTANCSPVPSVPAGGLNFMRNFITLILFRGGQFQVELAICKAVPQIGEHAHPNVDTILIHTGGELALYVDGKLAEPMFPDAVPPLPMFRVRNGQKHNALIGPNGAAFISVQRWLNGLPPGRIEHDWEGDKLDEVHGEQLEAK